MTQQPQVEEDLNTVSPLHCLMRTFEFLIHLMYHLKSGVLKWTESSLQMGRAYQHYDVAKQQAKAYVKSQTGITMDAADPTGKGGSTNKGDVCKRLMDDHREVLVNCVDVRYQDDFRELIARCWIVVKVYNSTQKVNVPEFKSFCLDTYNLILDCFDNQRTKWINISPTVHALLAHSWELIEGNDCNGLGAFTESGLEGNNKFLRFYRQYLSRKRSQRENITDTFSRLWIRSDPLIRQQAPRPICGKCAKQGHYTVSCPTKKKKLGTASTVLNFVEHNISILLRT